MRSTTFFLNMFYYCPLNEANLTWKYQSMHLSSVWRSNSPLQNENKAWIQYPNSPVVHIFRLPIALLQFLGVRGENVLSCVFRSKLNYINLCKHVSPVASERLRRRPREAQRGDLRQVISSEQQWRVVSDISSFA